MKYKEYLYLLILLLIASMNFNLFLKPINLVCGGTVGLSIIIHQIIPISYATIILVINVIMLILSLLLLNKRTTIGTIIATFIYPLFINLTNNLSIEISYPILNIILSGIISGITNGYIYKLGYSSGGISILGPIINKYFHISIGTIHFFINLIIIILDFILFGFNNFIYSLLVILINGIVINIILYKKIFCFNKYKI